MRKPKREVKADLEVLHAQVEEMNATKDWSAAGPEHMVAVFARCYQAVYDVEPVELLRNWQSVVEAARRRLEIDFGGDSVGCVEFIKWTWRRQKRTQETQTSDFVVRWKFQFSNPTLFADYKVYLASNSEPLPKSIDVPEQEETGTRHPEVPDAVDPHSDLGNAYRLRYKHGKNLRYTSALGWLVFDGARFAPDENGAAARCAHDIAKDIFDEATTAGKLNEPNAKQLFAFASKTSNSCGLTSMLSVAQSIDGLAISHNELDSNPWLLNVTNGTVELRTGELREHRREDLITKLCPVKYDPNAVAPTWLRFLDWAMGGDAELVSFLKRWIGYCLTGDVGEQKLVFHHGDGANGKSTFQNVVLRLLGDYARQAPAELLMLTKGESHPTQIADLRGCRLAVCTEVEAGKALAETLTKQLTGGDRICARRMHRDFFEFEPTHKLMIAGNHKPRIRGQDHAIWRRILLVPWGRTVSEAERDPDLPNKLAMELPGILAWAVEGCIEWQRVGLNAPKAVLAATDAYRSSEDTFARFLEDECILEPRCKVSASALYDRFRKWSQEQGEPLLTQREFGLRLSKQEFDKIRSRNGVVWQGLDLVTREDEREVERSSIDAFLDGEGIPQERPAN